MPSSDPATIPAVLSLVSRLSPHSILDVGAGNGRYGFLFREILDLNYGRLAKGAWKTVIDGVEADYQYVTDVHRYAYTDIYISDWLKYEPNKEYDIVFMGDVLEHFKEGDWQIALEKAKGISKITLVVSPNWEGSIAQQDWHGHEYERHNVALSPLKVGGRCLFANSKIFMCAFDKTGLLEDRDVLL